MGVGDDGRGMTLGAYLLSGIRVIVAGTLHLA
jgi:hypothetical protein